MIHQGSQVVSAQVEPSEVQALESLIEKLKEAIRRGDPVVSVLIWTAIIDILRLYDAHLIYNYISLRHG